LIGNAESGSTLILVVRRDVYGGGQSDDCIPIMHQNAAMLSLAGRKAMSCLGLVRAVMLWWMLLLSTALASAQILVIAPHPDDELITSAGVILNAVKRGEAVRVVYLTNGDYYSLSDGLLRQGESVTGQAHLGMIENNLIFLGYPDGYLQTIYDSYTNPGDIYTSPNGQSVTYGNRGLGGADYHYYRFGSHANYNRVNASFFQLPVQIC